MNNQNDGKLIPIEDVLTLMIAGNFQFTVKSLKTNDYLQFQVIEDEEYENTWKIIYKYFNPAGKLCSDSIGELIYENKQIDYVPCTDCMKLKNTQKATIAFTVLFDILKRNKENLVEVRGLGKCARCGRTLTTPESVDRGIGPECEKQHRELIKSML